MGKRTRWVWIAGLALALATTAWAQQTSHPKASEPPAKAAATAAATVKTPAKPAEGPDTVVLKVGNESATKADIEYLISNLNPRLQGVVAREGRKPLGDQYALMMVLSQVAAGDHLDATPDFKRHMAFQRMQALAQAEYEKISEAIKVSPEEINQYYTSHAADFDRAQVREFVIRKKAADAPASAPGLAPTEAHARADAIRKAIAAGTDIKQVAEKFSTPNVVMIDSEVRSIRRGQLIPALDKAAFELPNGQLSEPYETDQALAFVQVLGHKRADLKDVSEDIENSLRSEKLQAAVDSLKSKANIWMDEEYFKAPAAAEYEGSPNGTTPPEPMP